MYGQFAARCSSLAARRSPLAARRSSLAPRPGDLTPPDNSHCARPLSVQIYKYLPPALLETVAALFHSLVLDQVAAVHTIRRASFPPGLQRPN